MWTLYRYHTHKNDTISILLEYKEMQIPYTIFCIFRNITYIYLIFIELYTFSYKVFTHCKRSLFANDNWKPSHHNIHKEEPSTLNSFSYLVFACVLLCRVIRILSFDTIYRLPCSTSSNFLVHIMHTKDKDNDFLEEEKKIILQNRKMLHCHPIRTIITWLGNVLSYEFSAYHLFWINLTISRYSKRGLW